MHTIYYSMYDNVPAKLIVNTPYIRTYVWFWPILKLLLNDPAVAHALRGHCLTVSNVLLPDGAVAL